MQSYRQIVGPLPTQPAGLLIETAIGRQGMNVSIGVRWEGFVEDVLKDGRYGSASEVVREGLRLVEEREIRLRALRETLNASIAAGGAHTVDDIDMALDMAETRLAKQGY